MKCHDNFPNFLKATNLSEKTVIVADTGNNRVCVLNHLGKLLHFYGGKVAKGSDGKSHLLSDLSGPEDVCFSSALTLVIVADTGRLGDYLDKCSKNVYASFINCRKSQNQNL